MKNLLLGLGLSAVVLSANCASAKYRVMREGQDAPVAEVEADAPGGETFVLVVIYKPTQTPTIRAGGDSEQLVEATAAAARMVIDIALKTAVAAPAK